MTAAARILIGARLDALDPEGRRAEVGRLMAAHGARPRFRRGAWRIRLLGYEADCKATAEGAVDGWAWHVIIEARRARRRAA